MLLVCGSPRGAGSAPGLPKRQQGGQIWASSVPASFAVCCGLLMRCATASWEGEHPRVRLFVIRRCASKGQQALRL